MKVELKNVLANTCQKIPYDPEAAQLIKIYLPAVGHRFDQALVTGMLAIKEIVFFFHHPMVDLRDGIMLDPEEVTFVKAVLLLAVHHHSVVISSGAKEIAPAVVGGVDIVPGINDKTLIVSIQLKAQLVIVCMAAVAILAVGHGACDQIKIIMAHDEEAAVREGLGGWRLEF